ncbi:hypothetical protein Ancab_028174 [Ancistrocladus abbreviatus]
MAQEAENLIEHFMLAVEKQKRGTFWDKVSQSANYVSTLHGVAEKTKKINKVITNIYDNFQLCGINMNGAVNNNDLVYPCPKSSMAVFVSQEYDTYQVVLSIIKNVMPKSASQALKEKSMEELRKME